MNNQNLFNKANKISLYLDNSETYDIMLSDNNENDYYKEILDFDNDNVSYNNPIINESLNNLQTFLFSINLTEIDLSDYDENYKYSGLTFTLNYTKFTNYFNSSDVVYNKIILNTDVYSYTGITNEIHYFKITTYNRPYYIPPIINLTEDNLINKFSKIVIECENTLFNEECCTTIPKLNNKPRLYKIDSCDNLLKRRYEGGWTLDFIFNRNNLDWSYGGVFYHLGTRCENDIKLKSDNDLSFAFDSYGSIVWFSTHFSGYTNDSIGYSGVTYISSGKTNELCVTDGNKDFKITIVFERNSHYDDINNNGGSYDLITGCTLENDIYDIISGNTPIYSYEEVLNSKWSKNLNKRLGTLKIYLNAQPIYSIENWEETIPYNKGYQPLIQTWGGGSYFVDNILHRLCYFNIKNIRYFDKPLLATEIKHNFNYDSLFCNFESCRDYCTDNSYKLD
jgi:hypothetical protein